MTISRAEVITLVERRRRWSQDEKERLVAASLEPGANVEEPQAGQAGQEGFEQQLAEAGQAAPAAPKRANRNCYPHLSEEDRDLIDKAIAQWAAQRNLSPSSASTYIQAIRRLVNDLRARGKTTDLGHHQSLVDHVNTNLSNPSTRSTMLTGLNALGAYLDSAPS
ncbi:hypothetical protein ABIA00_003302 [Bradyrhizobium ottawaense]|uniref:hypothetical protein n=1 Tax=Bradyrhizobium ottawaense TaxID=931866 RepID=UPI00383745AF